MIPNPFSLFKKMIVFAILFLNVNFGKFHFFKYQEGKLAFLCEGFLMSTLVRYLIKEHQYWMMVPNVEDPKEKFYRGSLVTFLDYIGNQNIDIIQPVHSKRMFKHLDKQSEEV